MNADTPQRAREGNLLSNHRQGSARPSSGNKPHIARDVYPRRAGPIARIGKLYRLGPSYFFTDTDTAFTEDTQVMVPNKEGAIGPQGQFLWSIRWESFYTDVIYSPLQFAVAILGARDTSFLNCSLPETDIEGTAALAAVTGKACVRVSAQNSRQVPSAQIH
jgi:hypothetical protein